MKGPEATIFGNMLTSFQKKKKLAIEMGRRTIMQRNKVTSLGYKYRLEENDSVAKDGAMVHRLQLWQLVDEEQIRITTSVDSETITAKDELRDLLK